MVYIPRDSAGNPFNFDPKTGKVIRRAPVRSQDAIGCSTAPQPESPYCYCKEFRAGSEMVFCDNKNCQNTWYHFECLPSQIFPEGSWICQDCANTDVEYLGSEVIRDMPHDDYDEKESVVTIQNGPPSKRQKKVHSNSDTIVVQSKAPKGVLLGCWAASPEVEKDKHAVFGAIDSRGSLRISIARFTRDGRPMLRNFPNTVGGWSIPYNQVIFEPRFEELDRSELKKFVQLCHDRQYSNIDEEIAIKTAKHRVSDGSQTITRKPLKQEPRNKPISVEGGDNCEKRTDGPFKGRIAKATGIVPFDGKDHVRYIVLVPVEELRNAEL